MKILIESKSLFCVLVILVCCPPAIPDDALKSRVDIEYPAALAELESRYKLMHGRARYHDFRSPHGQPTVENIQKIDFAFTSNAAKISVSWAQPKDFKTHDEKNLFQTTYGTNSQYWFSLLRRHPSDELALKDMGEDPIQGRRKIDNFYGAKIQCAYSLGSTSLAQYFERKVLQINSVEEINVKESKALLIGFTVTPTYVGAKPANALDVSGWLVVSPSDGWILREYGHISKNQSGVSSTRIGKIDYVLSADGHLDPFRHVQRSFSGRVDRNNRGAELVGFELDFDEVEYKALPETDFHLPAFGLPEIDHPPKKGVSTTRPYSIFALAGIGLGLAGGLNYLSSRLKRG